MIYKKNIKNYKIVKLMIVATIILVLIVLSSKFYDIYQVHKMNQVTQKIYNHPLRVSNISLRIQTNLYKIHRNMKDVVLYDNDLKLQKDILDIYKYEKEVYKNLDIIKELILGKEGKSLVRITREMFEEWKPIRNEVITLVKNKKYKEAIFITQNRGAVHVELLEFTTNNLNLYAQDKATFFKNKSINIFNNFEIFNLLSTIAFIVIFLIMSYVIIKRLSQYIRILEQNKTLLETVISESPNPIMLHNEDGDVLMVNKIWNELTGYTYEEIDTIDKWTQKAYGKKAENMLLYINYLYKTNKRVDESEYEIIKKDGKKIIWAFSAAPLGIINGRRTIISSAMDVTELKNKDTLMYSQARHAAMGEMLANISHQWRQPLSLISSIVTGIDFTLENNVFKEDELREDLKVVNKTVQYLSKTIDDFSNFFNPNKNEEVFYFEEVLTQTLNLLSSQFKNKNISIIENIENIKSFGFKNELVQVVINILNNAKDALILKSIEKKLVFIDVFKEKENIVICIKDNAGGIKSEIIEKIFEPYFTTKHQSQGTGIGLYMTEEIIKKHMNGKIEVFNDTYIHEDLSYTGALFKITIAIKDKKT